jgi:hypothetical protein
VWGIFWIFFSNSSVVEAFPPPAPLNNNLNIDWRKKPFYRDHSTSSNIRSAQKRDFTYRNKESNKFVMSKEEAKILINQTYRQIDQVGNDKDARIPHKRLAYKIYHSIDYLGAKELIADQLDLDMILNIPNTGGFEKYVMRGGRLPSNKFMQKYSDSVINLCLREDTERLVDFNFTDNSGTRKVINYSNEKALVMTLFDPQKNGDIIYGSRKSQSQYLRALNLSSIGIRHINPSDSTPNDGSIKQVNSNGNFPTSKFEIAPKCDDTIFKGDDIPPANKK